MHPTIHEASGNDLGTRGYGTLTDAISCEVTEELNGGYTLEMKYPPNGVNARYLVPDNIIVALPNHTHRIQPFRIRQIKENLSGSLTVYANHISYDLSGYPQRAARSLNSLTEVITALNSATYSVGNASYHAFKFYADFQSNVPFSLPGGQTLRSWMGGQDGSILDTYGGEWEYDNFNCTLKSRRGQDYGVRISYGNNLADYENQQDASQYSHVVAIYKSSDTLRYSDLVPTGLNCPFRCEYVDVTKDYSSAPSTAQLNNSAQSYLAGATIKAKSIKVTPAQLGTTVGLGDTVLIAYREVFQVRVIKTVWNVLTEKYNSFELGEKKESIADTIKSLLSGSKSTGVETKQVTGSLNSYGCINTNIPEDKIIVCAKATTASGNSYVFSPLVAGTTWWVRAINYTTSTIGSGAVDITVFYV